MLFQVDHNREPKPAPKTLDLKKRAKDMAAEVSKLRVFLDEDLTDIMLEKIGKEAMSLIAGK